MNQVSSPAASSLFETEAETVIKSQQLLSQNNLSEAELRREYAYLSERYNQLLQDAVKSSYITDNYHRETTAANNEIQQHKQLLAETFQQIRYDEAKLLALFDNAVVGICMLDKKGRFVHVNSTGLHMLGDTDPEIFQLTIHDIIHPEDRTENQILFEKLTNAEINQYQIEKRFTQKDGSNFWGIFSASAIRSPNGGTEAIAGILIDIQSRKQAELNLLMLKKAMETTEVGITITDPEGQIVYTNPADAAMHGYSVEELLGQRANIFTKPDWRIDIKLSRENFQDFINWKRERLNVRRDGTDFYVRLVSNPIQNDSGEKVGVVTVCEDITQRKLAENALRESEQQLRELNATKDKFFSIIAHDLKNPLTTLLGFSELYSEKHSELDPELAREAFKNINDSSTHLYKLLENLLEWARAQTGLIEYIPTEFSLNYVVEECLQLLFSNAQAKKIRLESKILETTHIFADRNMVTTIIRNLVSNAIKFTPVKGYIHVTAEKLDRHVEIAVHDTGVGLTPDVKENLFRLDTHHTTTGTQNESGTGLGLILCKEFVSRHGGEIWVESEVNRGSSFKFTLPASKN